MNIDNLVRMANRIGAFFEAMPDRQEALQDIAQHIKRFWAPRMRRELLAHVDEQHGDGLDDVVLVALRQHRALVD
ncbi:MAG: formate dehydrogenase [Variovorax sp.]|nr:MAG: formate dehydrogenase [Variovorax sp.]